MTSTSGAPPGTQRGERPQDARPNAATSSHTNGNSVPPGTVDKRQVVEEIGRRVDADNAAFEQAYKLGHDAGWQIGYAYAHHEMAEQDRLRMARMHDIATTPAYAELERIRWDGRREDFGKPRPGDFNGFGADYEPSQYYVPLHPGTASAHRRHEHLRVVGDGQGAA